MGIRKRNKANILKDKKKKLTIARLRNCPISPRKMRLVADLLRGKEVGHALNILKFNPRHAAKYLEKLLLSALSNWQSKNKNKSIENNDIIVNEIRVDGGRMLKRLRPAPQGRAHRIRKRSNHVTVVLESNKESK
tara:strand:+ start:9641 stop:10045 length:405 start_codon:yes stop_codon:yes gene_type:complete